MARKTFCDGCDESLKEHLVALVAETQGVSTMLAYSGGSTEFHWCGTCAGKILKFSHDLRKGEASGT